MFKFIVQEKANPEAFVLSDEQLQHMKVVRIKKEKFIAIFKDEFYECTLENDLAKIVKKRDENHEFSAPVWVAVSLIETGNWEWMLQKATELGATHISPILSDFVTKKIHDYEKRMLRWNKIVQSATEQSFRNHVPTIDMPITLKAFLKSERIATIAHKYFVFEKANSSQKLGLFEPNSLFLIGPEGGFSASEADLITEAHFQAISLGKRILRTETAVSFVLSRVNPTD